MISFIVPVYYQNPTSYIVVRANSIIEKFEYHSEFELIIVDASKNPCLKSDADNIKIIHAFTNNKYFSPALARNQGVGAATKKYLFFFDVDLEYDDSFEKLLMNEIFIQLESGKKNFLMIPCLYLSKLGTELLTDNHVFDIFKESFLKGENNLVLRLAINTSALVMERNYFLQVGMFSCDFQGHGGEDFELIHRLSAINPHSIRNNDYYLDQVEQFPAHYVGFRQYMSYYALPHLFSGLLLVHKWHERSLINAFYLRRKVNEPLLQMKMRTFDQINVPVWNSDKPLLAIHEYILKLMYENGYDIEDYPGLFAYKNGIETPKNSVGAKTRKLLTRPKEFFMDSKLFKWYKNNVD